MMPAKSTSDHRTYSSMIYGVAGIASRPVEPEREARVGKTPTPGSAGRRSGARGGASASVPVVAQAVGAQPAPQRRATDAEAPRGLGELALRHCEGVQDSLSLALRQRGAMLAVRQKHDFTELDRALLQRPRASAERDEPVTQVLTAVRHAIAEGIDRAARTLVCVQHPAVRVEHDHAFIERFHHRLSEGREARLGSKAGVLFACWHTLDNSSSRSKFQKAPPLTRPAVRREVTQRNLSAAGPAALPAPGAAARRATARSTGGAAPRGSQIARPPACHGRR